MPPDDLKHEGASNLRVLPLLKHVRDVSVEDTVAALNALVEADHVHEVLVIAVNHDGTPTTMYSGTDAWRLVGLLERLKLQVLLPKE